MTNSPKQLLQKAWLPKTTLTCLEDPPVELQHCPAVIIITLLLALHDVTSLKHCTILSSLNDEMMVVITDDSMELTGTATVYVIL